MWPKLLRAWKGEDGKKVSHDDDRDTVTMRHSSNGLGPQSSPIESQISEDESEQTTPRAKAQVSAGNNLIPSLLLEKIQEAPKEQKPSPNPLPKSQLIQKPFIMNTPPKDSVHKDLSAMPPPPRPSQPSSLLMPPSTRQQTALLRPLPKTASYLGTPPSAASKLRTPNSQISSQLTTSTLPPSTRSSKKVILTPGHSPLDWAHLTTHPPTPTFLRGADLPPTLIRVTPSLLKQHNGRKGRDAWSTWQGRVYNVTAYLKFHPGGEGELLRGVGRVGEAEKLFIQTHAWVNWEAILGECLVGEMVSEGAEVEAEGGLDEMD
ncbi:hypothetical protein MMC14_010400 [Varicellaria rhodocarpa]|nr:hypothetical protein [Varicellaria rhodocarpa]